MTGYPEFNFPAFHRAAASWREQGHHVLNPAEFDSDTSKAWEDYMRVDLAAIFEVDALALLPGWRASKGACAEVIVAKALGLRFFDAETGAEVQVSVDFQGAVNV